MFLFTEIEYANGEHVFFFSPLGALIAERQIRWAKNKINFDL